jgi:predicted glycosyltransferase
VTIAPPTMPQRAGSGHAAPERAAPEQAVDVLFWVQHLLGIGHLTRAATLVRALRRAGLRVTLVSGGLPVEGLELEGAELVQLEPVQSDGIDFKVLLDARGRPVDEAFQARRRDHLLETFRARRPRLVMLEMFPFGRRQMRFELLPLLDAIRASRPRPLLVGSVRDILVRPPKPERLTEMLGWAEAFDRLLVHGDPDLVPFRRTFPDRDRLGDRLIETGYVVEPVPGDLPASGDGAGEVVVSTGGGRVGDRLLEIALEASAALPAGPPWRLLVGQHLPDAGFRGLVARAGPGVTVERARPDFRALLGRAAVSVSQGGYNTVMEVLAAGCPAVVVPYAGGLETEQTLRCRLLAERGLMVVLDEATLDAATLVAAVQGQLAAPPKAAGARPRMDGGLQTARLLSEMLVQTTTRNQR